MKNLLAAILLLITFSAIGQSINDYKYAIVPSQFKFLDSPDLYRMNTFTKMYMEKYGFLTYFDTDILPTEVAASNCNRVYVDIVSTNTMFTSKLQVVLRDCTNKVLYTSAIGESREKDYKVAYPKALREAFSSFDALGYKYNGTVSDVTKSVVRTTNDGTNVTIETITPKAVESTTASSAQLFAQPIEGGYQVVDSSPKVVMLLRNTSADNVFIAEHNDIKGIVFYKHYKWYFEYYANGKMVSQAINIKF